MAALLVVLTIVVAVAIDILIVSVRRRRGLVEVSPATAMHEPRVPPGLFLDRSHSWARIAADGSLRVGVDDLLAEIVGEVEGVDMPEKGTQVDRGAPLFTLRLKGRELAVPAPASGEVVAVNPHVVAQPWSIGRDPYGVGWVAAIWVRDHQEAIRPLRIGASATGFLRAEFQRFVDFLTRTATPAEAAVLADGGVPFRGVGTRLSPEQWDAFRAEFVETGKE